MAKKTANLGKAPVPVKGGLPALQEWSDIDLRIYHGKAQGPGGMLRGRSPDQVLADAIAAGWRPCAADPMALLLAFSQEDKRQLRQGTFHFGGQTYGCPELDECHDDQVRFLAPECADWDWPGLPLLDGDGKPYALARVVQSFAFDDIDGAKAASRRKGANRRSLTALEKSVPPLALAAERRELAEAMGPSPSIEPGARVLPSPDGAKIIRLMQDAPYPIPMTNLTRRAGRSCGGSRLSRIEVMNLAQRWLAQPYLDPFRPLPISRGWAAFTANVVASRKTGVMIAPPGSGKTITLAQIAYKEGPLVCSIKATRTSGRARTILARIAHELEIYVGAGNGYDIESALWRDLPHIAEQGCWLIIDEAQNLEADALRAVLDLNDEAGLPILLAPAMTTCSAHPGRATAAFDQIRSRIREMAVTNSAPTQLDVDALSKSS